MLEIGRKYPVKGYKNASASVIQRANEKTGTFWVKICGLTYNGVFLEYTAGGKFVEEGTGIPEIDIPEEDFKLEEDFTLQPEEEDFTL